MTSDKPLVSTIVRDNNFQVRQIARGIGVGITPSAQTEPSIWISAGSALVASLGKRRLRWNVESMYMRDEREFPTENPLKPTSLNIRVIAEIIMLNSKR